ncbi:cache domain-containing protein [Bacteriovorax sp. DB6_IX]|uniref:cache domain-containing protein n=1 Tax=Bacteriovorax sp. DB6_IX TaxID=1353530 RepID=UPI00054D4FE2|nr:cache domain-containing protein [Bacteriovorax sp. DB6_IX]
MNKLALKTRLIVVIAALCIVCILSVAFISTSKSKTALLTMATNQLESSSIMMKSQIERYLNTSELFTLRLSKDRLIEGLFIAYEGAFYGGGFSTDKDEKIITPTYLANEKLYGKRTRELAKDFGFSNIMLASVNGQIIMSSVSDPKYNFLGRSLTKGVLKGTNLESCFNKAKAQKDDKVFFSDFQNYKTASSVYSFLCKKAYAEFDHEDEGIYKGDELGVVIAQLSNETLAKITGQRTGMGETGQTYLIGPDYKLRSDFALQRDKFNMNNSLKVIFLLKLKLWKIP